MPVVLTIFEMCVLICSALLVAFHDSPCASTGPLPNKFSCAVIDQPAGSNGGMPRVSVSCIISLPEYALSLIAR